DSNSPHLLLLRLFGPGVLQGDGSVEDQLVGGAVFIECEIAEALVLVAGVCAGVFEARLALGGYDFQGVRVEELLEVAACIGLGDSEEPVVEAPLGVDRMRCADPVDRAFDLAAGGRAASFAAKVG